MTTAPAYLWIAWLLVSRQYPCETRMDTIFDSSSPDKKPSVLTISELNRTVAGLLERSLPLLWVSGEISNLTRAASGHWYFTLKDSQAQVRAVMFRGRNQTLDWQPKEGDAVEARVLVTLYEARGEFQLNVETLRRAGRGSLYEQFLQRKQKLAEEGWFDAARKRPLPVYPRYVGIISSPQAAALQDVLTALKRRAPHLPVRIYPALVQGSEAPSQLLRALAQANARAECDVLLLVRGGGSLEDLWAFNDEALARAIAQSPLPVVSGVGHETDFTLADFAADVRAPTPTAAAELTTAGWHDAPNRLQQWQRYLQQTLQRRLLVQMQRLDGLERQLRSLNPQQRLQLRQQQLDHLTQRLRQNWAVIQQQGRQQLQSLVAQLNQLNPRAVLERGYSITRTQSSQIVRASEQVQADQVLQIELAQGRLEVRVVQSSQ